jgi:type II secretory pathway pseudopilin PulG
MSKGTIILISVLVLALLAAFAYIGYSQYQGYQENKQITAYATYQQGAQQGVQYGYEQAVNQLYGEALKCQPVPIFINNQTQPLYLIAIGCPGTENIVSAMEAQAQASQ